MLILLKLFLLLGAFFLTSFLTSFLGFSFGFKCPCSYNDNAFFNVGINGGVVLYPLHSGSFKILFIVCIFLSNSFLFLIKYLSFEKIPLFFS